MSLGKNLKKLREARGMDQPTLSKSDIPELRNMDFLADNSPYMRKLASFYRENLQLARLMDGSDIMFHAHGPAAGGGVPRLGALNWLGQVSDKVMRGIATALLRHG